MTRLEVGQSLFGALFIVTGSLHFVFPRFYQGIIPPYLPAPALLVAISGGAEIAGGIGFLVDRWRPLAGLGLIVLLVAVFPANVEMLRHARGRDEGALTEALLWARLPLQALLVWWSWRLSRPRLAPGHGEGTPLA